MKELQKEGNVLKQAKGLLPDETLQWGLRGRPTELVFALRQQLANAYPTLREKLNTNSKYLGYGLAGRNDCLYVYVGKKHLLIDVKLPANQADRFSRLGFEVCPRDNYQGKIGWLTGVRVPHDTRKRPELASLVLEAFH